MSSVGSPTTNSRSFRHDFCCDRNTTTRMIQIYPPTFLGVDQTRTVFVSVDVVVQISPHLSPVHQHSVHQSRHAVPVPVVSSASSEHDVELGPDLQKIGVPPLSPRRTSYHVIINGILRSVL